MAISRISSCQRWCCAQRSFSSTVTRQPALHPSRIAATRRSTWLTRIGTGAPSSSPVPVRRQVVNMHECGIGQARVEVNVGTRISYHAAVPVPSVCEVAAAAAAAGAGATGSRRGKNHSRSATTGLHCQHGTLVPASSRANEATLMQDIVIGVPRWCQIVGSDLGLVAPGTAGRGAFRAAQRGSGEWHTVLSSLARVVVDAQVACMREIGYGFSFGFEIKA